MTTHEIFTRCIHWNNNIISPVIICSTGMSVNVVHCLVFSSSATRACADLVAPFVSRRICENCICLQRLSVYISVVFSSVLKFIYAGIVSMKWMRWSETTTKHNKATQYYTRRYPWLTAFRLIYCQRQMKRWLDEGLWAPPPLAAVVMKPPPQVLQWLLLAWIQKSEFPIQIPPFRELRYDQRSWQTAFRLCIACTDDVGTWPMLIASYLESWREHCSVQFLAWRLSRLQAFPTSWGGESPKWTQQN